MSIEEGRRIEYAMCIENKTIWPKTIGKKKKKRGE